jgi:hypothetical protein
VRVSDKPLVCATDIWSIKRGPCRSAPHRMAKVAALQRDPNLQWALEEIRDFEKVKDGGAHQFVTNPYGLIVARKYVRIVASSESSYTPITLECFQLLPSVNLTEPGSAFRCTGGADVRS